MRYKLVLLFLLFSTFIIYCLPSALANPVLEFQYDEAQPGETILATISTSGEFVEQVEESQIKFFKGRMETVLEVDILLYNNTHYLSIYTNQEANLTLQIENILYKESDILQSLTISRNLTIRKNILIYEETNETYTEILKIRPGFIFSSSPKLKLTNMGTRPLNTIYAEEEILINPLAAYELELTPEELFSLAKISTYKDFLIPTIYLAAGGNKSIPISNLTENNISNLTTAIKTNLKQNSNLTPMEMFTDTKYQEIVEILNIGDSNITSLKITSSLNFIIPEELQDMPPRGVQNLTLEFEPKIPGNFQGTINISYIQNETENILKIPLNVLVLPSGTLKEDFTQITEKCSDIGQVCESGTVCNGTATFTDDYTKYCCPSACISTKGDNDGNEGSGWLVAIVIFVILGYAGYYFYNKQKQIQAPTPKDSIRATTERLEKRLSGQSQRTTGNLTKS